MEEKVRVQDAVKRWFPRWAKQAWHAAKRHAGRFARKRRRPEEVFRRIYLESHWGGGGGFYSGSGSHDAGLVEPYVSAVSRHLRSMERPPRIVDLGCGDFNVGSRFLDLCSEYVAVDIVPELIEAHKRKVWDLKVRFVRLNIIEDPLPEGEVCFLRQVFQHLSNAQISKVLPKLRRYREVFITEHHPEDARLAAHNIDKLQGADIRITSGSGVYLDRHPFNLDRSRWELVLEVPYAPGGLIRTFKYSPEPAALHG